MITFNHFSQVYYLAELMLLQERTFPLKIIIRKKNVARDRSRAHVAAGQLMDPVLGKEIGSCR